MARIGIFGGSFNPPHLGHVQALREAQRELGLERILMMPAATPPHKTLPPHSPDAQARLELCRLATAELPGVEVSELELRREGPSYTVDTLRELRALYPEDELVLLVGTDMFLTLDHWYHSDEICRLAHIAFAARQDASPAEQQRLQAQRETLERLGARVTVLHNEVLELSSTTVRRMLAFGCGAAYLLPAVAERIETLGLYRRPASLRQLPTPELEQVCLELLDPKRVPHVLGCRDTAVELAQRYGCDVAAAERAALLHDVTKALALPEQLQLARRYGMIDPEFDPQQPQLLHAITGALAAERVFGEAPEVCAAVRWHTTGRAAMTPLEKILYLADGIEPNRDYEGLDEQREAVRRDLDEGLLLSLERSVENLRRQGRRVGERSLAARDWLLQERNRA